MSSLYDVQTLGFKPESTYGTDPISLASTEYWQFGKYTIPWGNFPTERRNLQTIHTGAAVTPQAIYLAMYHATQNPACIAVNGIPLYLALGKVTNAGASDPFTHTIEARDVGSDLPSFTIRSEDANDSVGIYESIPGSYMQMLTVTIDFSQRGNELTYQMQTLGKQIASPQFAGASDAGSLVFPGSLSDSYQFDTNTVAKWDATFSGGQYSSGGDDIVNDILNFSLMINNFLTPDKPSGQDFPDNYLHHDLYMGCSFDLIRTGSTTKNVYDDFVTMQDNSTTKNFHFKIFQDATHYLQIDMSDFTLGQVTRPYTLGQQKTPVFRCNGAFKTIKIDAVDSLAGATYYA